MRPPDSRFWLRATVVSAAVWAAGGLLGALSHGGALAAQAAVVSGVGSCCILACALLTLAERRGRERPSPRQVQAEASVLLVMVALLVLAEVTALAAGRVSYGPVVTLGCLGVVFCIWIAGPVLTRRGKFDTPAILKILLLGCVSCLLLGKFFSTVADLIVSRAG